eukprot:m.1618717 g.1618717  ORF g.1618717 m.1618717 type:complete len:149 (+) comp25377_c0_seq28:2796-3242(+)
MNLLTEHAMLLRITGLMIRTATNTPVQNPLFSGEDGTLSMSVLHHAPDEFDGGVVKSATHAVDIVDEVATNITVVHVDKLQMGLGGVDSWGSSPLDQYRIPLRSSRYSFWMIPFANTSIEGTKAVSHTPLMCFSCTEDFETQDEAPAV